MPDLKIHVKPKRACTRGAAVWLPYPTLAPTPKGAGGCGYRAHRKPIPRGESYYTYGIVERLGWVCFRMAVSQEVEAYTHHSF